jgi:hypothetical protein
MLTSIVVTFTLSPLALASNDLVVHAGQALVYDTGALGPLNVDNLVVEPGGTLRVVGTQPFTVHATADIRIDGMIDLSAFDNPGVVTLNTTNIPEPGAAGGPAGGRGGTGSWQTTQSTPFGGRGFGALLGFAGGGGGGETSWTPQVAGVAWRRGSGGGGGAFAANQPVSPDPESPLNVGLVAQDGQPGTLLGFGAVTGLVGSKGGRAGKSIFRDGDPTNDFFGRKLDPATGQITVGELLAPIAGCGGGAGGDASYTHGQTFPATPFLPTGDEKGSGGGGGGGLGIFVAQHIVVGPQGRVRCDGGKGGGGENTLFLDRVGGGSGGGSGGMIAMQAASFDLTHAHDAAFTARGGGRGPGANNVFMVRALGEGGHGGPGLIQIHVADPAQIALPAGKTLADLASPAPHVLVPYAGY